MKYIIVVDKQTYANPSNEKREYEINIDELRKKGEVHDDLKIEQGIAKVYRRIGLTKTHMTYVLDSEVIEELGELKIKLFEGDNYIYIKDEYNNRLCAEYIVKSDFTDMYVTKLEMNSVIEQTSQSIDLSVNRRLEEYSTTQEMHSAIEMKADSITSTVSNTYATKTTLEDTKKTLTASIELKINKKDLISELNASADIINLKSNRLIIDSTYFKLSSDGNITATSGTIGGFTLNTNKFKTIINGIYDFNYYDVRNTMCTSVEYINKTSISSNLYDLDGDTEVDSFDARVMLKIINKMQTNNKNILGTFEINTNDPKNFIAVKNNNNLAVSIGVGGINTHLLSAEAIICGVQTDTGSFSGVAINGERGTIVAKSYNNLSLESIKKNITKFDDALEIIKNSTIYEYNFKTEKDTDKKHIGFVIGDVTKNKYKTPESVLSNNKNGIENYSMSSIEWRALQQILERLEIVERRIS